MAVVITVKNVGPRLVHVDSNTETDQSLECQFSSTNFQDDLLNIGIDFLDGTPIGSYEETSALVGCNLNWDRSTYLKGRYDPPPTFRRPRRRLLNPKGMGSNASRQSGKGLSGRRTQSSGSLYRMLAPRVGMVLNRCGDGVKRKDRNKFCGSLPNRLDEKQISSGGSSPDSLYYTGIEYGDFYQNTTARGSGLLLYTSGPQAGHSGGGNQGYGSEWSPEDDPTFAAEKSALFRRATVRRSSDVHFITKENTFETTLEKGSRGLGLSVTGGVDAVEPHPGLIRIKRIFPHEPAWETGALEAGDIILDANGTPLTGLTNHEALEVLRTTPSHVVLRICRPPRHVFRCERALAAAEGRPPAPPKRDSNRNVLSASSQYCSPNQKLPVLPPETYGEFDLVLMKINGSLGFTLRKEDESILGHYVRALVREPALSDGRIRPGDKIVSVNGKDISSMSHSEAVAFLRQCEDEVRLRLYRDPLQTPVSALSPTESHKAFRPRPALRKEAMDMLCTLAVRKLSPADSGTAAAVRSRLRGSSPAYSPRRRKLVKIPKEPPPKIFSQADQTPDQDRGVKECSNFEAGELASLPAVSTLSSAEFYRDDSSYQSTRGKVTGIDVDADADAERKGLEGPLPERDGTQGLLKWKGVVFDGKEKKKDDDLVLTVELCKGWNSRLGFSLRSSGSKTLISAIYPESVAAKDGRLRAGDEVIMINEESTEGMATASVIELLRKTRGATAITIVRKGGPRDPP